MVTNVYVNFTVRRLIFFVFSVQRPRYHMLLTLYGWDVGLDRTSPGLRCLHKLTYEHFHLTPALRMRVYMAVQVFENVFLPPKSEQVLGFVFQEVSLHPKYSYEQKKFFLQYIYLTHHPKTRRKSANAISTKKFVSCRNFIFFS